MKSDKPLGMKSYGSIPHLPNSRAGQRDFQADSGMVRIATEKTRDKNDLVIVTEKVDGSNCSVAKINGELVALGRAGYRAETSPYEQHKLFAEWVKIELSRFQALLQEGERVVGEWMAQAHGTIYRLPHEPFIVFDLMRGHERAISEEFESRVLEQGFILPHRLHTGDAISVDEILKRLEPSGHGAVGLAEGAVWRVERAFPTGNKGEKKWKVDFLVKYVRPEKVDGCLLPEQSGKEVIWNWQP
jgi:hypothetical protein